MSNSSAEVSRLVASLREAGIVPSPSLMTKIGSPDVDHFFGNMRLFMREVLARCQVNRNSHIVDIGSGCGVLSLPLSRFLGPAGRYVGVDVWEEGNNWCRANTRNLDADIAFFTQPVQNNYYFAPDNGLVNDLKLDQLADNSFDVGIALSVFNHLKNRDVVAYISELHRVLKPGGVAFISGFVIDDAFFEYVARTNLHTQVKEDAHERGSFYAYALQDFFAGFTLPLWYEMFRSHGLRVVDFEPGTWANKKDARLFHDNFIVEKLR